MLSVIIFSDSIAIEDLKNLDVMPVHTFQEHPTLSYWLVSIH